MTNGKGLGILDSLVPVLTGRGYSTTTRYFIVTALFFFPLLIHRIFFVSVTVAHGPVATTIEIPIDHFNASDIRTYSNRYWINDRYYQKGGPVFFYDSGEAGVSGNEAARRLSGKGFLFTPVELARKYHGIAIIWEHRFYGSSLLFAVNSTTGIALVGYDAYKYLTNEQALEDAVYFVMNFSPPGLDQVEWEDLRAQKTPCVWIGASYAGIRAAMIRQRNPDVFFAGWASSAAVETVVDGSVYYNPLQQSMPRNCSADVNAAIRYADSVLISESEEEISILKRAVFFTNATIREPKTPIEKLHRSENLTHYAVASILTYPFLGSRPLFQAVGYGHSLSAFCNRLETWNPASFAGFNLSSPPSTISQNSDDANDTAIGVAATYGAEKAFYAYLYATMRKGSAEYDASFPDNRKRTEATHGNLVDRAAWTWQLCSQFGQFQTTQADSSPETNLISRWQNMTSMQEHFCRSMHPYSPELPRVEEIRDRYGGWGMSPSNVMWTNRDVGPFRALGVHAYKGINPAALDRTSTTDVPQCNTSPTEGFDVFELVYVGWLYR